MSSWSVLVRAALVAALCAGCAGAPKRPAAASTPAADTSPWPTPSAQAAPAEPPLDREVLFGNPERTAVRLSPDGQHLSWLAPDQGVLNVWVAPREEPSKARAVTHDRGRGVRIYFWAYDGKSLLYLQDQGGDENWRLYAANVATGENRDLTPLPKVQARVLGLSPEVPGAVLVGLNDRNPQLHDVYRVDLATGARSLVLTNDAGWASYVVDPQLRVRLAQRVTPEGGMELFALDPKTLAPAEAPLLRVSQEDMLTTGPLGFDQSGKRLYLFDSRGRNASALVELDPASQKARVLAEHPRVDVDDWMRHPRTLKPQAVAFNELRKEWKVLDPKLAGDLAALRAANPGELEVLSRTLDDAYWVVGYEVADGPVRYFLYDTKQDQPTFLFTQRPALEGKALAPMHAVSIPSRDGLSLVSYLSVPTEVAGAEGQFRPTRPVPLVLLVHGGPWARDSFGYDPYHQWLANRGYAVLSVNFRGSTGFGKAFVNAGDKEWAGKMHLDLLDAVDWAVQNGVTLADSVAVMGGSYGGYATLVGLTFTPTRFACGVDIVGPSNLETLLATIPPYWEPMRALFAARVGDPSTAEGKALLQERSPLSRVERIERPLLIGQGANDPRVKQAESDQIVQAMQKRGIPVTYVLFPDEGHGFARPENRLAFNAVAEGFLARCLGGGFQPLGDDVKGASLKVPVGASAVPGLADALPKAEAAR